MDEGTCTASAIADLGLMNQGDLEGKIGDEEGVVRSVVDEDAEDERVPRKESQDEVRRIEGGEDASED